MRIQHWLLTLACLTVSKKDPCSWTSNQKANWCYFYNCRGCIVLLILFPSPLKYSRDADFLCLNRGHVWINYSHYLMLWQSNSLHVCLVHVCVCAWVCERVFVGLSVCGYARVWIFVSVGRVQCFSSVSVVSVLQVKLEEALALATEFHNSLQDFINWLTQAEQTLTMSSPASLILETILFQIDEHKVCVGGKTVNMTHTFTFW